jgi:protein TonB
MHTRSLAALALVACAGLAHAQTATAPPAPPASATMEVADGTCPRPDLPPGALRQADGRTAVDLTVNADGHVVDGRIVGASGPTRDHRNLDAAVLTSLRQCTFQAVAGAGTHHLKFVYAWHVD